MKNIEKKLIVKMFQYGSLRRNYIHGLLDFYHFNWKGAIAYFLLCVVIACVLVIPSDFGYNPIGWKEVCTGLMGFYFYIMGRNKSSSSEYIESINRNWAQKLPDRINGLNESLGNGIDIKAFLTQVEFFGSEAKKHHIRATMKTLEFSKYLSWCSLFGITFVLLYGLHDYLGALALLFLFPVLLFKGSIFMSLSVDPVTETMFQMDKCNFWIRQIGTTIPLTDLNYLEKVICDYPMD